MLEPQDVQTIVEIVRETISAMRAAETAPPIGHDALVIDGTYDKSDGTVTAKLGDTDTMFPDSGDAPVLLTRVPLATTQVGDQTGPRGDERAVLLHAQGGPIALFIHDTDDSPGAPAGERWMEHRNAAGIVDSYFKHTNDGSTPGDGLGAHLSNGGALHRTGTSGGRSITQDDTAKKITVSGAGATPHTRVVDDNAGSTGIKDTTAGGLYRHLDDALNQIRDQASSSVYVIYDAAGNAISHVAPHVGVGALWSVLAEDATRAALAKADLTTFEGTLFTQRLADMLLGATTLINALISTSSITNGAAGLAAAESEIGALVLSHLGIPDGSSIVRLAT